MQCKINISGLIIGLLTEYFSSSILTSQSTSNHTLLNVGLLCSLFMITSLKLLVSKKLLVLFFLICQLPLIPLIILSFLNVCLLSLEYALWNSLPADFRQLSQNFPSATSPFPLSHSVSNKKLQTYLFHRSFPLSHSYASTTWISPELTWICTHFNALFILLDLVNV